MTYDDIKKEPNSNSGYQSGHFTLDNGKELYYHAKIINGKFCGPAINQYDETTYIGMYNKSQRTIGFLSKKDSSFLGSLNDDSKPCVFYEEEVIQFSTNESSENSIDLLIGNDGRIIFSHNKIGVCYKNGEFYFFDYNKKEFSKTFKCKFNSKIPFFYPELSKIKSHNFTYINSNGMDVYKENIDKDAYTIIDENSTQFFGFTTNNIRNNLALTITKENQSIGYFQNDTLNGPNTCLYHDGSFIFTNYVDGKPSGTVIYFKDDILTIYGETNDFGENYTLSISKDFTVVDFTAKRGQKPIENSVTPFTLDNSEVNFEKNTSGFSSECLDELIGLESVKERIFELCAYAKKRKGAKDLNLHMIFSGNPGTGKTEVARRIGKVLYDNGVLSENVFIEASRSTLVGKYQGHTADKVAEAVEKAKGGILFIDEAYALVQDENDSFGKECINELTKQLEDHHNEFCCIMAGYQNEMDKLLLTNPGLKRRFSINILFEDYTKDELIQIAHLMLKKNDYTISDIDLEYVIDYLLKNKTKTFANAREVRQILENIYIKQAVRTVNNESDTLITREDIDKVISPKSKNIDAQKELNELIGLNDVKSKINKIIAVSAKMPNSLQNLNFIFTGNPGTGKTEVARILGKLLYQKGIVPTDRFVELTRGNTVAKYMGQTAANVRDLFDKAIGGVIFIDEAYSLANGNNDEFGTEAITELVAQVENNRGKLAVIFAGYEREMKQFLQQNSGLLSRANIINFPDYTYEELVEIAKLFDKKEIYNFDEGIAEEIAKIAYSKHGKFGFGNAREIRETINRLVEIWAVRTIDSDDYTINMDDINEYIKEYNVQLEPIKENKVEVNTHIANSLIKEYKDYKPASYFELKADIIESIAAIYVKGAEGEGNGSGFLISPDGYIVTCNHVIEGAETIKVRRRLLDRRNNNVDLYYDAKIIASDKALDIAVIKIEVENAAYVPLLPYDYPRFEPLDPIIELGYPLGVSRFDSLSINEGKIISYQEFDASSNDFNETIHIDIQAKPGNSGSCIIDKNTGYVIGILCGAKICQSDSVERINYCRPIKYIWELIK